MGDSDGHVNARDRLRLGPLTIDRGKRRLMHDDGRELFLEPRVVQVLAALVEADGDILSRDDLVNICWDGRAIGDEAVFRAISRLRQATEGIATGVFRIETIPKAGYRLVAEEPMPPAAEPSSATTAISRRGVALGAGAVALAGVGLVLAGRGWLPASRTERLVVLPFGAMNGAPAYLADGFVSEMLDGAARIEGLEAVGSASSFRLPAAQRNAAGAAEALGATIVLEGQVAATADAMTVSATLSRTPEGSVIWSKRLNGSKSEIFRLRDKFLARIGATAGVGARAAGWRAVDPEALRLYLLASARHRSAAWQVDADQEALLDRAVARDPGFAEAWAALGAARLTNTYRHWITAPRGTVFDRDRLTAAIAAAGRASALKPAKALPVMTNAGAMAYRGAWAETHRAAPEALTRGGAPSRVLLRLGQRREAVRIARAWAKRDPLNYAAQLTLGQSLQFVGDHSAAVTAGGRAFALIRTTGSYYNLLTQLISARRFADARRLLDDHPALLAAAQVQFAPMTRDWFLYLIGDAPPPDPEAILAQMDRGDGFHEMAAIMFARLGALRHGAMMLDRMGAYELPVIDMIFGEDCAPLRRLPAFGSLMQRVGLAAFWREEDHWPDFRFTLDARVGRSAAP